MDRITRLFNKEFSRIGEAALVLASFTLLSQILGIFRDRFLAGRIGTGELLDIYYAAFRIPDLLFTLAASLLSVSILMPYFTGELKKSKKSGYKFINDAFTAFFILIVVLSVITAILMPYFTHHLFPGFSQEALDQTVLLSRVMLLSPILLGISNLLATITQAFKQFFVYALAPIFYNLGIIIGILLFYPMFGLVGLAYGVGLGALLHMLIQLPVVMRQGFLPKFQFRISFTSLKDVLTHSLPRTLTLSMSKIVFLIFVSLASTLIPGTISIFNLSYNLQSVPLAIIGVSYSVAAFPLLVEYFNTNDLPKFFSHVIGPIRQIIFWSLPIVSLFIVLRAQIVRVILGTGNFDWADTRLTAASLALFIISVVAQSIVMLLIRAYYASGKTWKPFWMNFISSGLTVGCAFLFIYLFNHFVMVQNFFEGMLRIRGVEGSAIIMLSLAYSVGMFISMLFLWVSFKKDFKPIITEYGIKKTLIQSLGASGIMGVVAYILLNTTDQWFNYERTIGVFGHGVLAGVIALTLGIIFLLAVGNNEILVFWKTVRRKLPWKKRIQTLGTHI